MTKEELLESESENVEFKVQRPAGADDVNGVNKVGVNGADEPDHEPNYPNGHNKDRVLRTASTWSEEWKVL